MCLAQLVSLLHHRFSVGGECLTHLCSAWFVQTHVRKYISPPSFSLFSTPLPSRFSHCLFSVQKKSLQFASLPWSCLPLSLRSLCSHTDYVLCHHVCLLVINQIPPNPPSHWCLHLWLGDHISRRGGKQRVCSWMLGNK